MPRVLFVSYVFPPMVAGGAVRTGQFARFLPECGWDVTVLTVQCAAGAAIDHGAVEALPANVGVVRAWGPNQLVSMRGSAQVRHGASGWLRRRAVGAAKMLAVPDRQITWYPMAVRRGRRLLATKTYDAILASYGPATSALVGARLAAISGLPFVLDFRDLWSDLPLDVFASGWHRRSAARYEERCVAQAARVTCVSDRMADHLTRRHGLASNPAVAIPNGFDPDQLPPSRIEHYAKGASGGSDRAGGSIRARPLRIVYAGAVHRFQFVETFLGALRACLDTGDFQRQDIDVSFVGNLSPQIPARFGLDEIVRCEPFVPHEDVAALLAAADVLLLIEQAGYWGEFSYSAKTFDYAVTGKPVLAMVEADGNSAGLLRELGTGIIVPPDDADAIRTALADLVTRPGLAPKAIDSTVPPLNRFNRRRLTAELAKVLGSAVDGTRETSA